MLQHGRHKATPHLVLAISLLFTVIAAAYASRYRSEQDRLNFNQVVDAQQVKISEALGDRIALLRGIAGLFAARSGITDEEFQMYAADGGVRDYADIRAIGYSARVKDGDTEHYPITRLESSDNQNDRDLGFDLLTDPVMRPALEQARDSTLPAISNRWTRAADEPIFLICLPRYSLTASLETVEARRETLEGFVFAFIRPDTFTQGTLGARTTAAISLSIFNGNEVGHDRLLYATSLMPVTETPLAAERAVSLSGATWTLKFNQQSFFPNAAQLWFVFLASIGGLVSFVLFFVTRSEAVAHVEADERAEQLEQHRTKLKELISHRNRAEETLRDKEARLQIASNESISTISLSSAMPWIRRCRNGRVWTLNFAWYSPTRRFAGARSRQKFSRERMDARHTSPEFRSTSLIAARPPRPCVQVRSGTGSPLEPRMTLFGTGIWQRVWCNGMKVSAPCLDTPRSR